MKMCLIILIAYLIVSLLIPFIKILGGYCAMARHYELTELKKIAKIKVPIALGLIVAIILL